MTDHADTIRRVPELVKLAGQAMQNDPDSPAGELVREWKRLKAELRQAQEERDRANEAFTAQADLRYKAEAERQQAIDERERLQGIVERDSREIVTLTERCEQAVDERDTLQRALDLVVAAGLQQEGKLQQAIDERDKLEAELAQWRDSIATEALKARCEQAIDALRREYALAVTGGQMARSQRIADSLLSLGEKT